MTNASNPLVGAARDGALEVVTPHKGLEHRGRIHAEPIAEAYEDDAIDLRRYWNLLLRRKWTIILMVAAALVVSLVKTFDATPIYRATLLLQIDQQQPKFLEYQQGLSGEASWIDGQNFYQTQYELLKSRSLARRVIAELGLEAAPEPAADDERSFFADLKKGISRWFAGPGADKTSPAEGSPADSGLETTLTEGLAIEPVRDSRLVRIHYDGPDPEEAARIANAFAENFIDMTLERAYESTAYAKNFLEERIQQVRANLEDSEKRLIAYAKERAIIDLDNKLSNLMQTFDAMNQALVAAESERIQAESELSESAGGTGPATLMILDSKVIQGLKERKGELEAQYQEQLKVFKPEYPKMQQLARQIGEIDLQLKAEIAAIHEAVKANRDAKVKAQATLQARVGEVKGEILDLQDRSTDYQALKREVDTNRELYNGLLQRMKEIGVVAGIVANNVAVVDSAQVPKAPFKPNLRKNLMLALLLGLMGGILSAFLIDHLDDTIKSSEEVESRVLAPVLGVIPFVDPKRTAKEADEIALLCHVDPKCPLAEAARSLRTSLTFSTAQGAPKVMHFTSPVTGEGKTTAASSVAITFAHAGAKVLLIDCDLRSPSLHRVFSLPNIVGLSNYLTSDTAPAEVAQPTRVARLFAITSGPIPPNPVDLLADVKMLDLVNRAAERFDYVILDGPPIIGLADAIVLSKLAYATILVVDAQKTRYGALEGAVKRLRTAHANILGAVIDRFGQSGHGYGYGYEYHYSYEYGTREDTAALPEKA